MRPVNPIKPLAVLTLLAAFVLGATGAAVADEPADFAAALAKASQEDQVLVVDFFTDW